MNFELLGLKAEQKSENEMGHVNVAFIFVYRIALRFFANILLFIIASFVTHHSLTHISERGKKKKVLNEKFQRHLPLFASSQNNNEQKEAQKKKIKTKN